MFLKIIAVATLFASTSYARPTYEISSEIRHTLPRQQTGSDIIYYMSLPANKTDYPIALLCEGSSSWGSLESVMRLHHIFSSQLLSKNIALLTIEKWGIDGNNVDDDCFWEHYTRSQRLTDHRSVITHLQTNPPTGWNGKFIFLGGSEGGWIVTRLATMNPQPLATINWSGAGDWPWQEELWCFFQNWIQSSWLLWLYSYLPAWLPYNDFPRTRTSYDARFQEIVLNPTATKWLGGLPYSYHADLINEKPVNYAQIKAPLLVVVGTKDSIIESCDLFVSKAQAAGAPITYFRIEDMGHQLEDDLIDRSFEWLFDKIHS